MLRQTGLEGQIVTPPDDLEPYARFRKWSLAELIARAERLSNEGAPTLAAALYKNWIACNPESPWLHAGYFNYSVALAKAGDCLGAIKATRECIRVKPDFHPPYINLGRLLEDSGQVGDAVTQWKTLADNLASVNGDAIRNKLIALEQLGRVLEANHLDGAAEEALRQSLDISIAQPAIIQHWIALRQRQCKWPSVLGWDAVGAETLMAGISPLSLANISDDPIFQLSRAWAYRRDLVGRIREPPGAAAVVSRNELKKLRIGYVSSDFREHAVGFGMSDVVEGHDRNAFEISAYYCGISREDGTRARIRAAVDHWVDINDLDDEQAAARIRDDEIDILVDLNGYTKDARTRVFAMRPAPIIVNWFGFPGSMGSPDHHYIIADERIIPRHCEHYYSEKVVRLSCYQPNDRKRIVSAEAPSRAAEGLPDGAFVYCCLNGTQKFTSAMFASWMRILDRVPDSVLWLFGGDEATDVRLRDRAREKGVVPERLIFASKRANPEHVARYALADLFLDTFPYGAHTTAADAMWMGVPVVTLPGRTFASRVCASLVAAAGIGELVCADRGEYIALAIELARDPARLSELKRRLLEGRSKSLLFDTPRLARELEELFRSMWRDFLRGERPVPDLTNLDVYREIGLEIAASDGVSDAEYPMSYRRELSRRHRISPLPADSRLWSGLAVEVRNEANERER
jgi:predicted O-linked N-acetylglucosamine transferase (SPINDLY family)